MDRVLVRKTFLSKADDKFNLTHRSPEELMGTMWQLALDAWSFKENLNAEPRLQDMLSCLKDEHVEFIIVGAYPWQLTASRVQQAILIFGSEIQLKTRLRQYER